MIIYVGIGQYKGTAGEELVKKALADYSGNKYADGSIKREERGKPFFENLPVHFSVSHSGEFWVCLMADFNVGIDIQAYRTLKYEKVARRFFFHEEAEYVSQQGIDGFFQIWTRKEAYVKYMGNGLSGEGLSNFSVIKTESDSYFLKEMINDAYLQEINLNSEDFHMNSQVRIAGAVCSQRKDEILIKRL